MHINMNTNNSNFVSANINLACPGNGKGIFLIRHAFLICNVGFIHWVSTSLGGPLQRSWSARYVFQRPAVDKAERLGFWEAKGGHLHASSRVKLRDLVTLCA